MTGHTGVVVVQRVRAPGLHVRPHQKGLMALGHGEDESEVTHAFPDGVQDTRHFMLALRTAEVIAIERVVQ
eukprot:5903998-Prorocentrum_lima.AAC.1